MWWDDTGARRSLANARERYDRCRSDPAYAGVPALHKLQGRLDDAHFTRLSQFLRHPTWEGTNNGAERMGRLIRHLQRPRLGLRTDQAREGAFVARAMRQHESQRRLTRLTANRSRRGRKPRGDTAVALAA